MTRSVYLTGSIVNDPRCLDWRREAKTSLKMSGVGVLDPCEGKSLDSLLLNGLDCTGPMSGGRFVHRDLMDVRNADALWLHWWGDPQRQSIGTFMELGYAYSLSKPIVVSDPDGLIANHPFISELCISPFSGRKAFENAQTYLQQILRAFTS